MTISSNLPEEQLAAILATEESYQVLHMPCKVRSLSLACLSTCGHFKQPEQAVHQLLPSGQVGDEWRRKICQWSFRVIDHFNLDRSVVSFGLNMFDRFLVNKCLAKAKQNTQKNYKAKHGTSNLSNTDTYSTTCWCPACGQSLDSKTYQLAAMTALYIAIKLHPDNTLTEDGMRRKRYFRLESFVDLSRGQFAAGDICRMERTILKGLKWKVNPPTPMALVAHLLVLMPPSTDIPLLARPTYDLVLHVLQELSRYMTELSVCLGSLCATASASQVAYAAILVSMGLITDKALPRRVREQFHAAVAMTSLQSNTDSSTGSSSSSSGRSGSGVATLLMPHKQTIRELAQVLSKSLLPEMLLEEYDNNNNNNNNTDKADKTGTVTSTIATATTSSISSSHHPIVIARDYGLLNLDRIHRVRQDNYNYTSHNDNDCRNRNKSKAATTTATSTDKSTTSAATANTNYHEKSPTGVAQSLY